MKSTIEKIINYSIHVVFPRMFIMMALMTMFIMMTLVIMFIMVTSMMMFFVLSLYVISMVEISA